MTPLESLNKLKHHYKNDFMINLTYGYKKHFDIIRTALKRLEIIDNSVKPDMEYYEKRSQALEIIKEKRVNVHSWYYNNCNKIPYEIYKQSIMAKTISSELLTQEEFYLLKEVLLCGL